MTKERKIKSIVIFATILGLVGAIFLFFSIVPLKLSANGNVISSGDGGIFIGSFVGTEKETTSTDQSISLAGLDSIKASIGIGFEIASFAFSLLAALL